MLFKSLWDDGAREITTKSCIASHHVKRTCNCNFSRDISDLTRVVQRRVALRGRAGGGWFIFSPLAHLDPLFTMQCDGLFFVPAWSDRAGLVQRKGKIRERRGIIYRLLFLFQYA